MSEARHRVRYESLAERIVANIVEEPAPGYFARDFPELGPCWIWQRSQNARGYGAMNIYSKALKKMKRYLVHRLVLREFFGEDLDTLETAMHQCSVKLCCNPLHIMRGDNATNLRYYYDVERPRRFAIQVHPSEEVPF